MSAIYKREMKAYFSTFTGYVFIAAFLAISGYLFVDSTLSQGDQADITIYYTRIIIAFAILIPLLTMKLFTDEKKQKTEALLLTSPVNVFSIVFAKYLAAATMFILTFALSCINLIPMYMYGNPTFGIVMGNIISVVLVGLAFIAIGVFMSSLTENQIVAAVLTIAALALLVFIGQFSGEIGFAPLRYVMQFLSVLNRYTYFLYGLIDWSALFYYITLSFVFLFLTVRAYESKRWA